VDLDAVSLVSCMAIMEGGMGLFINACRSGNAVGVSHNSMIIC
jgi:hypothetical protein